MYIDRVCYRLPDSISCCNHPNGVKIKKKNMIQRSLTPHLDCCPDRLYESDKAYPKWRPIQAFVALTDTLEPNQGGFEACLEHHIHFDEWKKSRKPFFKKNNHNEYIPISSCVGDFTPIRPIEDHDIIHRFQHIPCRAGDLVCWDFRIPHANSRANLSEYAREVVYIGILPNIEMNRIYAERQLQLYRAGIVPDDQWHEHAGQQICNYEFSPLGRRMMTIDP